MGRFVEKEVRNCVQCKVVRKLRLYIYIQCCIASLPTGQLGQLGPVSSELPEQEGVSWLLST